MLHDLPDTGIALQDLVGLDPGMIEAVCRLDGFDRRLHLSRQFKMLVIDEVMYGGIVADLGEKLFDVLDRTGRQGLIGDKSAGRRQIELPGPELYDLLKL